MNELKEVQFRADRCSVSVRMRQHCDDAHSGCYLDRTKVRVLAMGALYLGDHVLEESPRLRYPDSIMLFHSAASIEVEEIEQIYSVGGPYHTQAWAAGEDGLEYVEITPLHFAVQRIDACGYPLSWVGFRFDQDQETYLATPWWSRTTLTREVAEVAAVGASGARSHFCGRAPASSANPGMWGFFFICH